MTIVADGGSHQRALPLYGYHGGSISGPIQGFELPSHCDQHDDDNNDPTMTMDAILDHIAIQLPEENDSILVVDFPSQEEEEEGRTGGSGSQETMQISDPELRSYKMNGVDCEENSRLVAVAIATCTDISDSCRSSNNVAAAGGRDGISNGSGPTTTGTASSNTSTTAHNSDEIIQQVDSSSRHQQPRRGRDPSDCQPCSGDEKPPPSLYGPEGQPEPSGQSPLPYYNGGRYHRDDEEMGSYQHNNHDFVEKRRSTRTSISSDKSQSLTVAFERSSALRWFVIGILALVLLSGVALVGIVCGAGNCSSRDEDAGAGTTNVLVPPPINEWLTPPPSPVAPTTASVPLEEEPSASPLQHGNLAATSSASEESQVAPTAANPTTNHPTVNPFLEFSSTSATSAPESVPITNPMISQGTLQDGELKAFSDLAQYDPLDEHRTVQVYLWGGGGDGVSVNGTQPQYHGNTTVRCVLKCTVTSLIPPPEHTIRFSLNTLPQSYSDYDTSFQVPCYSALQPVFADYNLTSIGDDVPLYVFVGTEEVAGIVNPELTCMALPDSLSLDGALAQGVEKTSLSDVPEYDALDEDGTVHVYSWFGGTSNTSVRCTLDCSDSGLLHHIRLKEGSLPVTVADYDVANMGPCSLATEYTMTNTAPLYVLVGTQWADGISSPEISCVDLSSFDGADSPTPPPSPSSSTSLPIPPSTMTVAPSTTIFPDFPESTLEAMNDFSTPQGKALFWIREYPSLHSLPAWRKKQIFAMVTYYWALNGPTWPLSRRFQWLDSSINECDWRSIQTSPCDLDGEMEFLGLLNDPNLRGSIPPEVGFLTQLEELSIVDCGLEGTAETVMPPLVTESLSNLRLLNLEGNALSGSIPSSIANFTSLQYMYLQDNPWNGRLPSEIGLLTGMKRIDLSNTNLFGPIPIEWGALTALEALYLTDTAITGAIPQEICSLPLLTTLEADCDRIICCN